MRSACGGCCGPHGSSMVSPLAMDCHPGRVGEYEDLDLTCHTHMQSGQCTTLHALQRAPHRRELRGLRSFARFGGLVGGQAIQRLLQPADGRNLLRLVGIGAGPGGILPGDARSAAHMDACLVWCIGLFWLFQCNSVNLSDGPPAWASPSPLPPPKRASGRPSSSSSSPRSGSNSRASNSPCRASGIPRAAPDCWPPPSAPAAARPASLPPPASSSPTTTACSASCRNTAALAATSSPMASPPAAA